MQPTDPLLTNVVSKLDEASREYYEERASIREHEGQLPRAYAEAMALVDLVHRYPTAFVGITVIQITLDGSTEFVITTDLEYAKKHLADVGAEIIAEESFDEVIERQYGGVAALTFLG